MLCWFSWASGNRPCNLIAVLTALKAVCFDALVLILSSACEACSPQLLGTAPWQSSSAQLLITTAHHSSSPQLLFAYLLKPAAPPVLIILGCVALHSPPLLLLWSLYNSMLASIQGGPPSEQSCSAQRAVTVLAHHQGMLLTPCSSAGPFGLCRNTSRRSCAVQSVLPVGTRWKA